MDIKAFCAKKDDPRDYLHAPMNYDNDLLATNGHILIVDSGKASIEYDAIHEKITPTFEKFKKKHYNNGVLMSIIAGNECIKCGGSGKCICLECHGDTELEIHGEFNSYLVDCKSCEAGKNNSCAECFGYGIEAASIELDGIFLSNYYINLCQKELSNFKICLPIYRGKFELNPVKIIHDNGYGFLMPIRNALKTNYVIK